MPDWSKNPELKELQYKNQQLYQKIRLRLKPENEGKYTKEEIDALQKEWDENKKKIGILKQAQKRIVRAGHQNEMMRTPFMDAGIAKELHYPECVINALLREPDEKKRQKIFTNARKGVF